MIYAFRIRQADGVITHHGVVTATNTSDLFYALDEYADPSFCEVKKIKSLSFCVDSSIDFEYGGFTVGSEIEFSDSFESMLDANGWYWPVFKGL